MKQDDRSVSIEEMKRQLDEAGWKRVNSVVWQSPDGCRYFGPHQAWRFMMYERGEREVHGE